jgi:geranylgeranylglycerol-phosphate geranylgeranyltransferase
VKIDKALEHVKTFLELIRIRNCLMTLLGVLLGASFIDYNSVFSPAILMAGVAAFVITGAGNVINDYFDYEIDRINRPKRALPSHKISKSDAMMLSLIMFAIGIGLSRLVNANGYCLIIAVSNSAVLILYGKYSKKMYLLANLVVAYLVASIFVYGAVAVQKDLVTLDKLGLVAVISTCAFFATLAREITKDIEDIKGDKKRASITLPIKMGEEKAKQIASTFLVIAILISSVPLFTSAHSFNLVIYSFLILVADAVFLTALTCKPSKAQKLMITGMMVAIVAFYAAQLA